MGAEDILNILSLFERLKCITRHSWCSNGRKESVAEHSWRMAIFAYVIKWELPEVDINKVILMCLVHDWGEVITGDIPTFEKDELDNFIERQAIKKILKMLGNDLQKEMEQIFEELYEGRTIEAKICHVLDKLECILQHNEADIKTWIPLEYELQLTCGWEDTECSKILTEFRKLLKEKTKAKIRNEEK